MMVSGITINSKGKEHILQVLENKGREYGITVQELSG